MQRVILGFLDATKWEEKILQILPPTHILQLGKVYIKPLYDYVALVYKTKIQFAIGKYGG